MESDDFKTKELLVKQWNATIDARNWLKTKKEADNSKTAQQKALTALESEFVSVLNGYAFAEQEKQQTEADIKAVETLIEREKDKVTVYENAQAIAGYMSTIADGRKKIETSQTDIAKENKALIETLQPAYEKAKDAVSEAQKTFDKQETKIKVQEDGKNVTRSNLANSSSYCVWAVGTLYSCTIVVKFLTYVARISKIIRTFGFAEYSHSENLKLIWLFSRLFVSLQHEQAISPITSIKNVKSVNSSLLESV